MSRIDLEERNPVDYFKEYLKVSQERDRLVARNAKLEAAIEPAVAWMENDGCDCGTDEPGSCALCLCTALLNSK
jgi:hypothetical protein